jgi:hypothetical protein
MARTTIPCAHTVVHYAVFASVWKLRDGGALIPSKPPDPATWQGGILEFSRARADGKWEDSRSRRLVLRHAVSAPDTGILMELYDAKLVDVTDQWLRVRGVEAHQAADGPPRALVQEWLVLLG